MAPSRASGTARTPHGPGSHLNAVESPVLVLGSGPAGVSAALALCERGVRVTMLDAGTAEPAAPPAGNFIDLRFSDESQWRWQLGTGFSTFDAPPDASPKLRVPDLRRIFEGYELANRVHAERDFQLVGALAAGGLSNAWGCGVARFDQAELGPLAADGDAMHASYERVSLRMGLSGAAPDGLAGYFGLDEWAAPALPLDALHARLWSRRQHVDPAIGFRIGRARVAVLNEPREGREPCDESGTCLWGCARKSTWSAALELNALRNHSCFEFRPLTCVEGLRSDGRGGWIVDARGDAGQPFSLRAARVLLATGTIATTRLVLSALAQPPDRVALLSNPTAAFLLLLPSALGSGRTRAFGLAQLSFVLDSLHEGEAAMGNLFSTAGLPVSEFLAHLPVPRRAGLPLLRSLLPSMLVGNVFLPGSVSGHEAGLERDGSLWIRPGDDPRLPALFTQARRCLSKGLRRLGAFLVPGSFVPGRPGADLHYAATLPIRLRPAAHECRLDGQVAGLPGVYAIDGACLPCLPAKAHTLTIMANADRIARGLVLED